MTITHFVPSTLFVSADKKWVRLIREWLIHQHRPSETAQTVQRLQRRWNVGVKLMEQVIGRRRGRADESLVHHGRFLSNLNPKELNRGTSWASPQYKLYQKGNTEVSPWKLKLELPRSRSFIAEAAVCCRVSSTELPVVVEKLRLSESSGEEQELVDDEELRRFREIKHKMTLLDEAELGSAAPRNNRRLFPATTRWVNQDLQVDAFDLNSRGQKVVDFIERLLNQS